MFLSLQVYSSVDIGSLVVALISSAWSIQSTTQRPDSPSRRSHAQSGIENAISHLQQKCPLPFRFQFASSARTHLWTEGHVVAHGRLEYAIRVDSRVFAPLHRCVPVKHGARRFVEQGNRCVAPLSNIQRGRTLFRRRKGIHILIDTT
jgi:hypothetical protein